MSSSRDREGEGVGSSRDREGEGSTLRLLRGGLWGKPRPTRVSTRSAGFDENATLLATTPELCEAVRLLGLSRAELAAAIAAELAAGVASDLAAGRGDAPGRGDE
jgi:hypothetical protein